MGLDCYLEDEFGEELESVLDEDGKLASAWPVGDAGYPLLRFVDTEGFTLFNRLQLAAAVPELERLTKTVPAATPILKLARKAAAEPHLYLRFLGD